MLDLSRYTQPLDRGKCFLDVCADRTAKVSDEPVIVPPGVFDIGAQDMTLPDCPIVGAGRYASVLRSSGIFSWLDAQKNVHASCCFELGNTILDGLTFESTCPIGAQSCLLGYTSATQTAKTSIIRNCRLLAEAWGLYVWSVDGLKVTVEDSEIVAGHLAVGAMHSNGPQSQYVDLFRTRLTVDPSRSLHDGAVNNPAYGGSFGLVVRGGTVRAFDVLCEVQGAPGLRACSVTDWFDGSGSHATVELRNFHSRVNPSGARESFDFDMRANALTYSGCTGNGMGGSISTNAVSPGTIARGM